MNIGRITNKTTKCIVVFFLIMFLFFLIGCNNNEVKELKVESSLIKTDYYAGDQIDISGLRILAEYKNGKTSHINFASNNDSSKDGYTYDLYKVDLGIENDKVTFEYKGKKISIDITVKKRKPNPVNLNDIRYYAYQKSISIIAIYGAEYKLGDGEWQAENFFGELKNGVEYDLYVRYKETRSSFASEPTVIRGIKVMGIQSPINENDIKIEKTSTSITITVENYENIEYKLDDGEWTTNNVFEGIEQFSSHTVYVRKIGTNEFLPSIPTQVDVVLCDE